jgi:hypothetical protein
MPPKKARGSQAASAARARKALEKSRKQGSISSPYQAPRPAFIEPEPRPHRVRTTQTPGPTEMPVPAGSAAKTPAGSAAAAVGTTSSNKKNKRGNSRGVHIRQIVPIAMVPERIYSLAELIDWRFFTIAAFNFFQANGIWRFLMEKIDTFFALLATPNRAARVVVAPDCLPLKGKAPFTLHNRMIYIKIVVKALDSGEQTRNITKLCESITQWTDISAKRCSYWTLMFLRTNGEIMDLNQTRRSRSNPNPNPNLTCLCLTKL